MLALCSIPVGFVGTGVARDADNVVRSSLISGCSLAKDLLYLSLLIGSLVGDDLAPLAEGLFDF